MNDAEDAVTGWVRVALIVLLAVASGVSTAIVTRGGDVERIAALEARAAIQAESNRLLDVRLGRMEDKIDRIIIAGRVR